MLKPAPFSLALLLGGLSWYAALALGSEASHLFILTAAGFTVAVVEGELSWTGLGGLYLGQIVALALERLLGRPGMEEPLGWQPLFLASALLAAAAGGAIGSVASKVWRERPRESGKRERRNRGTRRAGV